MTKLILWLLVINVVVFAEETLIDNGGVKVVAPILNVNEKPIEKDTRQAGRKIESEQLLPLPPIFPSFLQPGDQLINDQPIRRKGILTILVIKSNKKPEDTMTVADAESKLSMFKNSVSDSFSKLASMIMNDIFHSNQQLPEQQLIGGGSEDVDRKSEQKQTIHLLGGKDDIDSKFAMLNKNNVFNMMNQFNSNEIDQNDPYEEEEEQNEQSPQSSKFSSIMSWLNLNKAETRNEQQDGKKKCMMHSFMKLKASAYYRTIVHLLFISGVMLIILSLIILTIRVYKRRQALRYYSANMKVSTIDLDNNPKSLFFFRNGSVRNSYAQKQHPDVMSPPPPPPYEKSIDMEEKKSLPDYDELKKDQI